MQIRFLIDECLSPELAVTAKQQGYEGAHVRQLQPGSPPDCALTRVALEREDIIVTNNARDFRRLYARLATHPGLVIILPSLAIGLQITRSTEVIAFIENQPTVIDQMVTVRRDGRITIEPRPPIRSAEQEPS